MMMRNEFCQRIRRGYRRRRDIQAEFFKSNLASTAIVKIKARSWTAVAERSGDTAFERTEDFQFYEALRALESGVALRFPPQSMTHSVMQSFFGDLFYA